MGMAGTRTDNDGDLVMDIEAPGTSVPPQQYVTTDERDESLNLAMDDHATPSSIETEHIIARKHLERTILEVLYHDGFRSSTPQALDSFTAMVEAYLGTMIREIKDLANTSRREYAIPSDFETVLRRFNLPVSSLAPHLLDPRSNPSKRQYREGPGESEATLAQFKGTPLHFLGKELSGRVDKTSKHYIPSSFPDFPSQHTYKFTSEDDGRERNTQKIREEAAENAQQGEEALRRLVRASKMRKQKEVKMLAEGDDQGRERFRLWQAAMKGAISDRVDQNGNKGSEISDHSMIVNGDSIFARKDTSRHTDRPSPIQNPKK